MSVKNSYYLKGLLITQAFATSLYPMSLDFTNIIYDSRFGTTYTHHNWSTK